jgi:hypothetical protein
MHQTFGGFHGYAELFDYAGIHTVSIIVKQ